MDLTGAAADGNNNNDSRMTCFASQAAWLFRRPVSAFRTFYVNAGDNNNNNEASTTTRANKAVAHKVMVHLPDISAATAADPIYTAALDFLASSEPLLPNETIFYYGKKYNPKYRRKLPFSKDWMWIEDGGEPSTAAE